jgi:hypothetical protein
LVLRSDALANAVIEIKTNTPAQVQSGNQVLTYTDVVGGSQLLTQPVGAATGLQVVSGRFQVDSSATGNNLPVGGNGVQSSTIQTQTPQVTLLVARNGSTTASFVQTGKVNFNTGSGNGVPVFDGETVEVQANGALKDISIGSIDGNKNLPGDPLKLNNLDTGTQIPQLNGGLTRLGGGTLLSVLQKALDVIFNATGSQISYDQTNGVVVYVAGGKTYRFVPLGQPLVVTGSGGTTKARDSTTPSAGAKSSGAFTVASQGISLTVATSVAYLGDLNKALKSLDAASKLSLRSNGSLKITFMGTDYVTTPAGVATGGGLSGVPSFTTDLSGYLAFVDSTQAVQVLYPVFYDINVGDQTLKSFDSAASATENGDGTATMKLGGGSYTLNPDYNLIPLPSSHAADLFWSDSGKFYLRYPNGTAQGFTIH